MTRIGYLYKKEKKEILSRSMIHDFSHLLVRVSSAAPVGGTCTPFPCTARPTPCGGVAGWVWFPRHTKHPAHQISRSRAVRDATSEWFSHLLDVWDYRTLRYCTFVALFPRLTDRTTPRSQDSMCMMLLLALWFRG